MVLDNENETHEYMGKKTKQNRMNLNLIASLDFGSTITLGNINKEIPTRAPMSTLSQDQVTRLLLA